MGVERRMRNPLSYNQPEIFSGYEINEWCRNQMTRGTTRAREARRLLRKNYKNDRMYILSWGSRDSGSGSPSIIVFRRYEND